ncbi:MAG: VWA domain-containing protein, partial [Lachnospiraceae bacterium]|nr:VWA domain-containing protein [Lachnospiraceae bacterium]
KKLKAIPAEQRLMLVISDGKPNGYNYHLSEGQKDCQDAVSKAIKDGITTICAGIGSDTASVKAVYKEGISEKNSAHFLDITDLKKLPKAFIKIIKKALE